jgi:hypothetical protein
VLAVALVAGLVRLGWVWRHPSAFDEPGGFGMSGRQPVDEPLYAGLVFEKDGATGEVELDSVHAHVTRNSAAAKIEFYLCFIDPAADVGAIGSVEQQDLDDDCEMLIPAEGATMQLNAAPRQQLVVGVTLTSPGSVRLGSVDVTYSYGRQHGTQRTGGELVLATKSS